MHVAIDGLNFELPKGTGIKTYARSVVAALADNGHRVSLLSQRRVQAGGPIRAAECYLAECKSPAKVATRLASRLVRDLASGRLGGHDIDLDEQTRELFSRSLKVPEWSKIESLIIRPGLFSKGYLRAAAGLGPATVVCRRGLDVVFLTSPIPIKAKRSGMLLTVHDLIPVSHPWLVRDWRRTSRMVDAAIRTATRYADAIVCISHATARELIARYRVADSKVHVVYQPCRAAIAPLRLKPWQERAILEQYGVSAEEYLLFVGAIEPKKNLASLLQAMKIDKGLPPLVIAGPWGWDYEQERRLMEELGPRVKHVGYVSDMELRVLQRNAAVMVFPSITEGFGLPPLECLWEGVPCVVSDIPVFREIYRDWVTYVDATEPAEIAEGIKVALGAWLRDPGKRREVIKAVRSRFSVERFRKELSAVTEHC